MTLDLSALYLLRINPKKYLFLIIYWVHEEDIVCPHCYANNFRLASKICLPSIEVCWEFEMLSPPNFLAY